MSNQKNIDRFFSEFNRRFQQATKDLPDLLGTEVVNEALQNFEEESFDSNKWPERKDKKNTRPLLVRTGALRRSISILSSSPRHVVVGSVLPYASIHNYGGTINRAARSETFTRNRRKRGKRKGTFTRGTTPNQRGFSFNSYSYSMPRRQFIGATPRLKDKLETFIQTRLTRAFKGI